MNIMEDFESWFIKEYRELFDEYNPLAKDKKGFYEDRGTLGMWIVWQKKEKELSAFKNKIAAYVNENYTLKKETPDENTNEI